MGTPAGEHRVAVSHLSLAGAAARAELCALLPGQDIAPEGEEEEAEEIKDAQGPDTPIGQIGLPEVALRYLKEAGIRTLQDLSQWSAQELEDEAGLHEDYVAMTQGYLEKIGMSLRGEIISEGIPADDEDEPK